VLSGWKGRAKWSKLLQFIQYIEYDFVKIKGLRQDITMK
jgi:hypothetical protein